MQNESLERTRQLLAHAHREIADLEVARSPLRGGLEAMQVALVVARFVDERGRTHVFRYVEKELRGRAAREALVYEHLLASRAQGLAPRLLGVFRHAPSVPGDTESTLLCVEPVRRIRRWPWSDPEMSSRLLVDIAQFHAAWANTGAVPEWDYELELANSAHETLALLDACRRHAELTGLARSTPALRRLVGSLPRLRRELAGGALGTTLLHGDLHSGNVIMRPTARGPEPVLLDWGRARIGSPLEDVSSWLQSLGYWDDETRRRHDTLLGRYLAMTGTTKATLNGEMREAYWLAAASNVLAGALAYHLWRLEHEPSVRVRSAALRAACDCLRIVRRADAVWS